MHCLSLRFGVFLPSPKSEQGKVPYLCRLIPDILAFSNIWGASNTFPLKSPWPGNAVTGPLNTVAYYLTLRIFFFLPPQQLVITDDRSCLDWTSFQELKGQKGRCKTAKWMLITEPKVRGQPRCLLSGSVNCRQAHFLHVYSEETGERQCTQIKGLVIGTTLIYGRHIFFLHSKGVGGDVNFKVINILSVTQVCFTPSLAVFLWLFYFML